METVCWEIRPIFDGANYGTMLWHHTTVSRQWYLERQLSIPAMQTFWNKASKVIGSVEQGNGDAQPMFVNIEALVGKRNSDEVNRKALA